MSQYLIIFLIVAVFRGVVWVVQKVQQNAKAREALMAQQANAQMESAPDAVTSSPGIATRATSGAAAAPSRVPAVASVPTRTSDSARATRSKQRGQVRATGRGSITSGRGSVGARAGTRATAATTPKATAPPASGWATSAPPRAEQGTRQGAPQSQPASVSAPASRAGIREARVGQSSRDVRKLLLDRSSLRQAILAREILGTPRGMIA